MGVERVWWGVNVWSESGWLVSNIRPTCVTKRGPGAWGCGGGWKAVTTGPWRRGRGDEVRYRTLTRTRLFQCAAVRAHHHPISVHIDSNGVQCQRVRVLGGQVGRLSQNLEKHKCGRAGLGTWGRAWVWGGVGGGLTETRERWLGLNRGDNGTGDGGSSRWSWWVLAVGRGCWR